MVFPARSACSLGHGNEALIEAASCQTGRLAMAAPTLAANDRSLEAAKLLLSILPPSSPTSNGVGVARRPMSRPSRWPANTTNRPVIRASSR